jgi:hypothetical protein
VWMINLSQICNRHGGSLRPGGLRHRPPLKADTVHGIDFKNPFTMSKRAITARYLAPTRGSHVFISRKSEVVEPIGIEPMT